MSATTDSNLPGWHATTILSVRKGGQVVMAGDGQVSMGQTIVKGNAKKVRRLGNGQIIAGFAGATADAFTLFERLESKLERHPGQLLRACIELAKDWRTDRYLRRLEALMAVADKDVSLMLSGSGDVLEPEGGIIAIGSGGNYALSAARALIDVDGLDADDFHRRLQALYVRRDTGDQPAAPDRHEDGVDFAPRLPQHFHADGALTGNHVRIVIGMHEGQAALARQHLRVLIGLVVRIAVQHHFGAARRHRGHLDLRRGHRHDDGGAALEFLRGQRHALRMVAG